MTFNVAGVDVAPEYLKGRFDNMFLKPKASKALTAEMPASGALATAGNSDFRQALARLSGISPYLLALALPGSFVVLPIVIWWKRRRAK